MRAKAAAKINSDDGIKWRSHEPSRIETFSDAAFAFALTLIIVSIEVPKSFDDLIETMKGTLSFAICFTVLFNIWNSQNIFFRRFGVNDSYTIVVNAVLLFVVLIYTYPLKFLCELMFSSSTYLVNGHQVPKIHDSQMHLLMLIYGAGIITIYLLFYLMYKHVQKFAHELELSPAELYETQTEANINLLCIGVCIIPMTGALIFPNYAGPIAFAYFGIPLAYTFWFSYRGKKKRKLFPANG